MTDLEKDLLWAPEPEIINILHGVYCYELLTEELKEELLETIDHILMSWEENENIDQLRDLLGVKLKPGRRRTARDFQKGHDMAYAYAKAKAKGMDDAAAKVADDFSTSKRSVERAYADWKDMADAAAAGEKHSEESKLFRRLLFRHKFNI